MVNFVDQDSKSEKGTHWSPTMPFFLPNSRHVSAQIPSHSLALLCPALEPSISTLDIKIWRAISEPWYEALQLVGAHKQKTNPWLLLSRAVSKNDRFLALLLRTGSKIVKRSNKIILRAPQIGRAHV